MPPNIDTLRDSGIGLAANEMQETTNHHAALPTQNQQHASNPNLSRNEPKRSSFGMALKDRFNKNPNMYFPAPERSENNLNSSSRSGSNKGSYKSRSMSTGSPTKTHTSVEDDLSDTDTLIHNMSDGSYEKEGSISLNDEVDSFGSAKGSRSSGNSSLSPHNSMEGSPRMVSSSASNTGTGSHFQPPNHNSSGISLGKKTIRNYTPNESSNMLREFEDRRNNSVDWRHHRKHSKPTLERKSSMERMIDDFHKSLPPPDSTLNTTTANSSKRPSKNGTMTSQVSNWSAASSAASFDYQPGQRTKLGASPKNNGLKKVRSTDLPSLDEDENEQPTGERVPPEGAPSATGVSPTNFVQRIEVKSTPNNNNNNNNINKRRSPSPNKPAVRRKSSSSRDGSEGDKLPPPPPPPPPQQETHETPKNKTEHPDDFSKLQKLISEGRISGLNEKPPSFVPPSPPAVLSSSSKQRTPAERSVSATRRPSSAVSKTQAPNAPNTPKTPKSSHSAERQPSRKNREAPKPPMQSNVSTPNSEIKFVSSRYRESMEDLTQMNSKTRNEVKRSSSNHGTRPSGKINFIFGNFFHQFIGH